MVVLHNGDGLRIEAWIQSGELVVVTHDDRDAVVRRRYTILVPEDQMPRLAVALGTSSEEEIIDALQTRRHEIVSRGVRSWLTRRWIGSEVHHG